MKRNFFKISIIIASLGLLIFPASLCFAGELSEEYRTGNGDLEVSVEVVLETEESIRTNTVFTEDIPLEENLADNTENIEIEIDDSILVEDEAPFPMEEEAVAPSDFADDSELSESSTVSDKLITDSNSAQGCEIAPDCGDSEYSMNKIYEASEDTQLPVQPEEIPQEQSPCDNLESEEILPDVSLNIEEPRLSITEQIPSARQKEEYTTVMEESRKTKKLSSSRKKVTCAKSWRICRKSDHSTLVKWTLTGVFLYNGNSGICKRMSISCLNKDPFLFLITKKSAFLQKKYGIAECEAKNLRTGRRFTKRIRLAPPVRRK